MSPFLEFILLWPLSPDHVQVKWSIIVGLARPTKVGTWQTSPIVSCIIHLEYMIHISKGLFLLGHTILVYDFSHTFHCWLCNYLWFGNNGSLCGISYSQESVWIFYNSSMLYIFWTKKVPCWWQNSPIETSEIIIVDIDIGGKMQYCSMKLLGFSYS